MITIEEYIKKRKTADSMDEKDKHRKSNNLKLCLSYVVDYFDNYIDITQEESKSITVELRAEKYLNTLSNFSSELQDWLVKIYLTHGNQIDNYMRKILDREYPEFYLLSSEEDLRGFSYFIFPKMFSKYKYLKNYPSELFALLKHYQCGFNGADIIITKKVNTWIEETGTKYNIDLTRFGFNYASNWLNNSRVWEAQCRVKEKYGNYETYNYDWKKAKDLFNLSILYSKYKSLPYIKNHMKDLEALIMYFWCMEINGSKEDFKYYIEKIIEVS